MTSNFLLLRVSKVVFYDTVSEIFFTNGNCWMVSNLHCFLSKRGKPLRVKDIKPRKEIYVDEIYLSQHKKQIQNKMTFEEVEKYSKIYNSVLGIKEPKEPKPRIRKKKGRKRLLKFIPAFSTRRAI